MKKTQFRKRRNGGFSLGELLITVAILVVLLAVAIPSVITIQKHLRQKELDSKAEIIYVAAQNSLSKLKAGGNTAVYAYQDDEANGVKKYPDTLPDADGEICYITSEGGTAAAEILAQDVVDDELRSNHWVVEYNPSSAIVYAVFYSADRANCAEEYGDTAKYNSLRNKKNRLSDGARVGYYGGGSAADSSDVKHIDLNVAIVNAEKLVANISCVMPSFSDYPVFKVVLKDGNGQTATKYYACISDKLSDVSSNLGINQDELKKTIQQSGRSFNLELVLDDLSDSSKRFHAQYRDLKAGTALTVTVTAMCPLDHTIAEQTVASTTNSLFADSSTVDTAVISYGRHLQNLDKDSGVDASITQAVQNSDITFSDSPYKTGLEDWLETYPGTYFNKTIDDLPNFKPIQNDKLQSFNGANFLIKNLTVEADSDAGLFAELGDNQTVQNVRLTGSKVKSTGETATAGALVGKVSGNNASIENCQVYLANSDYKDKDKIDNHYVWIDGKTAGGLIGTVAGGSVTVKQSSASTVVGGHTFVKAKSEVKDYKSDSVGGLIGSVAAGATANITESYADCYLFGHNVGGLVGTTGEGSKKNDKVITITSCYAAGFETFDQEGAGLVCGNADMQRSYTIMYPMYIDTKTPYSSTAKTGKATGNVYYLTASSSSANKDLGNSITDQNFNGFINSSSDVFSETGSVTPYNLMGQALVNYEYPLLKNVRHYGDWVANFQPGALVYYEAYIDGTYGFYGANVESTLKDDPDLTVIGDGYGVVYSSASGETIPQSASVTVKNGDKEVATETVGLTTTGTHYEVTGTDYVIYPLSKTLVNTTTASDKFYLKAEVKSGNKNDTYYFNPHFAKTVKQNAEEIPTLDQVSIRTARHLYMLSLYYDNYAEVTKGLTFEQERNIDYSSYNWADFSNRVDKDNNPSSQGPIAGGEKAFQATYDGNCNWITNVSFETDTGLYVGFIGRNSNNGFVQNVVLTATYDENSTNNYNVRRSGNIANNEAVYMGVLVGRNSGTITNCAVAGYYIAGSDGTIHAYENSYLYAGGLVGGNDGTITKCSADTPEMRLSSTFARAYLGGFAGENGSYISDCYALGHIEVAFAKGGSVSIAGFAGSNSGRIRTSYCATALTAVGDVTTAYGFAPYGGQVNSCEYLNNGTYAYVNHMYPFNFDPCAGDSKTFAELRKEGEKARAKENYNFGNTQTLSKQYPFRAVVRDAKGDLVHYGDWLDDENMGALGIFYWEHEEGGSNNGYHFTYLGVEDDGKTMGGTTLCNAHDDGGVITEYGYGYFELNEGSVSELKLEGATINGHTSFSSVNNTQYNQAASEALKAQMHKSMDDGTEVPYTFYAFTTSTDANTAGALCMKQGYDKPNCTWTLTWESMSLNETRTYNFTVSPFFANAMCYVKENMTAQEKKGLQVTAFDGTVTDYSQEPGAGENNQYEIRSVQQLQYINWNYVAGNTSTLVDGSHYKDQFTYLMYATATGQKKVTSKDEITNGQVMYWRQTHDLDGTGFENYTPIAGNSISTTAANYEVSLYVWFGGSYNGESYKIQNVAIKSKSYAVGLFGVTVGANMQNIIMYSDNDTVIQRDTETTDNVGAYSLGGLIGTAYDYNIRANSGTTNTIENCAIAGYIIQDSSDNRQGLGEANVGGLTGVANVYLKNCSAVTKIVIDSAPSNAAKFGNVTRVGGLTGAALGIVTNCYSGGSAEITQRFLDAKTDYSDCANDYDGRLKSTRLYIGGIVGSGFTSNYKNFTGSGSSFDGQPNFSNCYTYFTFPEPIQPSNGTEYTKEDNKQLYCSTVGSLADRSHQTSNAKITFTNCFYLDSIKKDGVDVIFEKEPYYDKRNGVITGEPESKTYTEMSDGTLLRKLGSAFSPVTTTEGSANVPIHGKYSFPGSNSALVGKDYPFPAVIQQKDLTFGGNVYVHYGDWPIDGPFWTNGRDSMDIFADMQEDEENQGYAVKTFYLNPNGTNLENLTMASFTCSTPGIAEVVAVRSLENGLYPVTIKALNTGSTKVRLNDTIEFNLEVTADIKVMSEPVSLRLAVGETGELALSADSLTDPPKKYETNANTTWEVAVVEDGCENLVALIDLTKGENSEENEETPKANNQWTVKREGLGKLTLKATFTYDYPSTDDKKAQFTGAVYIDVLQPDTLGLSDGNQQYNAVYPGEGANTIGENVSYSDSVKPQVEGADFFLYLDAEKLKMEDLTIQSIKVGDAKATQTGNVYTAGDFHIEMDAESTADTMYQYRSGSICYLGAEESPTSVPLTVVVKVGETDYTLTITLPEVKKAVTATFQDGSEPLNTFTKVLSVGTHKLPTQEEALAANENFAIPDGKMLAGWTVGEDEIVYAPGDVYDFTQNVTFTAAWVNAVNVTLDANGGQFQKKDETKVIQVPVGGEFSLEQYAPTWTGYTLAGWNTAANGSGKSYKTDATVSVTNLGVNPALYAQWNPTLTLVHERDSTEFTEVNGSERLAGYKKWTYKHSDGYELVGWYTKPNEQGTKILDAEGNVVQEAEAVEGYTEKQENGTIVLALTGPQTLYACWEKDIPKYVLTDTLVDGKDYLLVSSDDPNEPAETRVAFGTDKTSRSGSNVYDDQTRCNVRVEIKQAGDETYIEKEMPEYSVFHCSDGGYLSNKVSGEVQYLNVDYINNSGWTNYQYKLDNTPRTKWAYFGGTQKPQSYNQYVLYDTTRQSDLYKEPDNKTEARRMSYMGRIDNTKQDQKWAGNAFTVKATKDDAAAANSYEGANANMYIYEKAEHNYVFSGTATATTNASLYSAYSAYTAAKPAESAALTLVDGSRTVLTTTVTAGTASVEGYTAPERANSAWTLQGWYTAKDGTGRKVLNADGTVANNVAGYSGRSGLSLTGDTTLYACWVRQTDVFVRTDTLEKDADYMIVRGTRKEPYALGQLSGQVQFQQPVTIQEPGSGSYFRYDTGAGAWSGLQDQYLDVCPDQLVWHYTEDTWGRGTFTCKATNGALQQSVLDTIALWMGTTAYYRRTTVYEYSYADEYFLLTLCTEDGCTSQWVTVEDGIWRTSYTKPKLENAELVGWYDSPDEKKAVQVLDGDGAFASDNVKGYVKDGKWRYDGGSLTLYARWQEVQETQPPQESTEQSSQEDPADTPPASVPEEEQKPQESLPPEPQDDKEEPASDEAPDSAQPGE